MSNFSQFAGGGGIKSIQRGVSTLTSIPLVQSLNVTVSSVNTAKSELRLLGVATNDPNGQGSTAYIQLTSATNIYIARVSIPNCDVTVSWELVEWN